MADRRPTIPHGNIATEIGPTGGPRSLDSLVTRMELRKVFFYGSFMDLDFLRTKGVSTKSFEVATLEDWGIVLAPLATLIPAETDSVYGIVAELSPADIDRLYSSEEMTGYRPVSVTVKTRSNKQISATCYISNPVPGSKPSAEYVKRITAAARALDLPSFYVGKLKRFLEE